jgi:hypothetical protein
MILKHSLTDGFSKRELEEAMSQLMKDAKVRANEVVGWSTNRNELKGLRRIGL